MKSLDWMAAEEPLQRELASLESCRTVTDFRRGLSSVKELLNAVVEKCQTSCTSLVGSAISPADGLAKQVLESFEEEEGRDGASRASLAATFGDRALLLLFALESVFRATNSILRRLLGSTAASVGGRRPASFVAQDAMEVQNLAGCVLNGLGPAVPLLFELPPHVAATAAAAFENAVKQLLSLMQSLNSLASAPQLQCQAPSQEPHVKSTLAMCCSSLLQQLLRFTPLSALLSTELKGASATRRALRSSASAESFEGLVVGCGLSVQSPSGALPCAATRLSTARVPRWPWQWLLFLAVRERRVCTR